MTAMDVSAGVRATPSATVLRPRSGERGAARFPSAGSTITGTERFARALAADRVPTDTPSFACFPAATGSYGRYRRRPSESSSPSWWQVPRRHRRRWRRGTSVMSWSWAHPT